MDPTASDDGEEPTTPPGNRATQSPDGHLAPDPPHESRTTATPARAGAPVAPDDEPRHGLDQLAQAGVATWLDGLDRGLLRSGRFAELVAAGAVTGATTSPESFAQAVTTSDDYRTDLDRLARAGGSADEIALTLVAEDARQACDLLGPVFEATGGRDGWVAVPLDPRLAHDADATLIAARALHTLVDRPNMLVSVPATHQGVPALRDAVAEGISVNATSVFSLDRFRAVQAAYVEGLERAEYAGVDLRSVASFASLPLDPLDTATDGILDVVRRNRATALRGRLAIAQAVLAYQTFEARLTLPRWRDLAAVGAHPQRPVWTSTTVTDAAYLPTRYVVELVAPRAVVAMTEETLLEVAEHAVIHGDTIHVVYGAAQAVLDDAERVGISFQDVAVAVEDVRLAESVQAWEALLERVPVARRA